jgi:hypothetical protein
VSTIWDYVFDSEWRQRADIESLKERASQASYRLAHSAAHVDQRVERLEQQVSELALLARALVSVLEKKGGVTPDELHDAMKSIAGEAVLEGKEKLPDPPKDKGKAVVKRRPRRLD